MKYFTSQNGICTIVYEFIIFPMIESRKYDVVCGSCFCNNEKTYENLYEALLYASNHKCIYELNINMINSLCFCESCRVQHGGDF